MSFSFFFLKIIYDHPKKNDTVKQKGAKGATKKNKKYIYIYFFFHLHRKMSKT